MYMLRHHLGTLLRATFWLCSWLPGGRKLLTSLIGDWAPFTGGVGSRVLAARPGHARIFLAPRQELMGGRYAEVLKHRLVSRGFRKAELEIDDRPEFGNPFGSLHAVLLALLGYQTARTALCKNEHHLKFRSLKATYGRMAHGRLRARCEVDSPILAGNLLVTTTKIFTTDGAEVASVEIGWLLTEPENAAPTIDPLALLNIGEEAGGLALLSQLPKGGTAILSALEIEVDVDHQSSGPVVSASWSAPVELPAEGATTGDGRPLRLPYIAHASIRKDAGPEIAHVIGHWSVARVRKSGAKPRMRKLVVSLKKDEVLVARRPSARSRRRA
jgi:hypothetical protein